MAMHEGMNTRSGRFVVIIDDEKDSVYVSMSVDREGMSGAVTGWLTIGEAEHMIDLVRRGIDAARANRATADAKPVRDSEGEAA